MNRSRFDPFADLGVRDRLTRFLEEAGTPADAGRSPQSRVWQPPVDIIENQDQVSVVIDLPGVQRDSIDVQMTGENLTVRGERAPEEKERGHYVYGERPHGSFQRSFTIGVPVEADNVQAAYKDGVLRITLPKADQVKPRRVEIQTGE
jgi:HSP20 family protein